MKVTIAWIRKYSSGSLVGYADIRFALRADGDGCLTIRNWPVFKSDDGGLRVGMPSEKKPDGTYSKTVDLYFENEDAKALIDDINQRVNIEFNKPVQKQTQQTKSHDSSPAALNDNEGIPF